MGNWYFLVCLIWVALSPGSPCLQQLDEQFSGISYLQNCLFYWCYDCRFGLGWEMVKNRSRRDSSHPAIRNSWIAQKDRKR
ncbi:hypothetical protein F4781DRAFT_394010 [Annulohypoxylon bovei var. microspora]|nr:hypothetical protein F4781DRAFT_394010 [Annulohypoxylon bovei var. microspora]